MPAICNCAGDNLNLPLEITGLGQETQLDRPEKSTRAEKENAMAGHVLFHAALLGRHERN
jgi:hypothetical protein